MIRSVVVLVSAMLLLISGYSGTQAGKVDPAQARAVLSNLSQQPLAFTENRGQWDDKALFRANSGHATFFFSPDEVALTFIRNTNQPEDKLFSFDDKMKDRLECPKYKKEILAIRTRFIGANLNPEISGEDRLPYNYNYFYGNAPSKWRTDVPNYSSIIYRDIWPGIDLKYYGNGSGMKYDFILHPGADFSQIRIRYDGVENLAIANNGELEAVTAFGAIHENIPEIFQEITGEKVRREGRYVIKDGGNFGFEIDDYNPDYPLIIDPELVFSTYLGGSNIDNSYSIAVDEDGYAYLTGYTYSSNFPRVNPYDDSFAGPADAFVTKLSAEGNSIVYSSFLGGNGEDHANGIAVDGTGCGYLAGETRSSNFPMANPYDGSYNGSSDGFVTKLSAEGNSLIYSSYLGGGNSDFGYSVALDVTNSVHITGFTGSTDFPLANPYDDSYNGSTFDAFAAKLSTEGSSLIYSTYLGGSGEDKSFDIAVDEAGCAYLTGYTGSSDFPMVNSYDGSYNSGTDAFLIKLSPGGNSLVYSTYLGGTLDDIGYGIAVDRAGSAHLTGRTSSSLYFPLVNPYDNSHNGTIDAFVTKFSPDGNSLVYSTYLGGSGEDRAQSIAVDAVGCSYVAGFTSSVNFPLAYPYDDSHNGGEFDSFITKFSPGGNFLVYSTYLGGSSSFDYIYCIVIDEDACAYVTGMTNSPDFPLANPFDNSYNGSNDAFVTKLTSGGCPYTIGDINGNGSANGIDVTYGVTYLKGGNIPPVDCSHPICTEVPDPFYAAGDVNGTCSFNGIDITYYVSYLKGGTALQYCPQCPPAL